jgi:hypothetical protein
LRQSAYNISQSAGFSERHALRSGKNNFHGASVGSKWAERSTNLL